MIQRALQRHSPTKSLASHRAAGDATSQQRGWLAHSAAPAAYRQTRIMASFLDRFDGTAGVLAATQAARGTTENATLLIDKTTIRGIETWALVDVNDSRPLAWHTSEAACLDFLGSFVAARVFVHETAYAPGLFPRLDRLKVPWITNRRPDDSPSMRPLHGLRLWSNDPNAFEPISATSAAFGRRIADSALLQEAFLNARPLLLPAENYPLHPAELELSALIAAACGEIAACLWNDEAYVDPLMTLERFGDLDGVVRFEDDRIVVTPALGKRYMDLYRNGYFADVVDVPWLAGRVLQFGGL